MGTAMKQKLWSYKKIVLTWILIYILVLIFSIFISGLIIFKQNQNLINIAYADMQYYADNKDFAPLVYKHDVHNLFYDEDFQLIDAHIAYKDDVTYDFKSYGQKVYDKVYAKGMHYSIVVNTGLRSDIGVVIAYPYGDDGLFLFLKELSTLKSIFKVLFPSITLLVIICAGFTVLLTKKNLEFERMQREYVDNISHELKSPIASIKALTTGIYDGLVTDENKRKNHCSIMLNEVNQLERTVSDMLELSRIQNHLVSCEKEVYTITDLFGDIIEKRKILCEDLNITFSLYPEAEAFPLLYTNKILARRMMDILLDNAIKFTPVGKRIIFKMTEEYRYITIAIKDSGPGIHPEEQALIFKRFYKSDKSHNEKGSGLGLAIAKEIADSLGEKLYLKSSSSDGAEFAFTIHKA